MIKSKSQAQIREAWQFLDFSTRNINSLIVQEFFTLIDSITNRSPGVTVNIPKFTKNKEFRDILENLYPNLLYKEQTYYFYHNLDYSKNECGRCGKKTPFIGWNSGIKPTCCHKANSEEIQRKRNTYIDKVCVMCTKEYNTLLWLNSDTCSKKCANAKWRRDYPEEVAATQRKREATCLEKYGDKNVVNSKYTRDITKEKLGVEYPWQSKQIRDDINQRRFDQFGYYVATQNPEVAAKISATRIERYGDHLPQLHKYKEYRFPSGKSYKVQGYEPQAIDYLLKTYSEEDIILGRNEMLRVAGAGSFEYVHENKTRSYYPDIFIKSKNLFIEVKSTFTFDKHQNTVFLKQLAVKDKGFDHHIMIFHPRNGLLKLIE